MMEYEGNAPICPLCGSVCRCDDQWQRQYACYCGGGKRAYHGKRYAEESERFVAEFDDLKAAGGSDEELLSLIDASKPWNACAADDLRATEEYQSTLREYKDGVSE